MHLKVTDAESSRYECYFNGELASFVTEADEEKGWIEQVITKKDDKGDFRIEQDGNGVIKKVIHKGVVKLRKVKEF